MAADLTGAAPARRRPHTVRWIVLALVAAVFLPLVVVLGSRLGQGGSGGRSVLLGKPAPAFTLQNIDGGQLSSADLAGRPYVVNFWASWCVPCRKEHRNLQAFYDTYAARDVELLGVIFADKTANVRRYREELGGNWPLLQDPKGRTAIDFGVTGPPETFVVDAAGTVVAFIRGPVGPGALEDVLARLS